MSLSDLFLFATILMAGLIHGFLGMGFPMVATPLVALGGDVRNAIVSLLLPTLAINIVNVLHGGHWRESIGRYWPLALFGAVGSLMGTQLLVSTDPAPYKLLMALMILLYLNMHRIGLRMAWVSRHILLACALFGLLGGLLAGTVNVMLPALIIFSLEVRLTTLVTVQLFNFCFLMGKLSQGIMLVNHRLLGPAELKNSLVLVGLALAALAVGIHFRDRINPETFRGVLKKVLAIIAVLLIVQYFIETIA